MDTHSIDITIYMTKSTLDICFSQNASFDKFLVLNNGRIRLKKRNFLSPTLHKPMITMTIEWHGFGHFFIIVKHILGSLTFMIIALLNFQFGFVTGGHGSDVV